MFPEQLKKILRLIKQTRDRVVIFDGSAPDDSYVLMDLDSYAAGIEKASAPEPERHATPEKTDLSPDLEKKQNLTDEDLTDKINREISLWKNKEAASEATADDRPRKGWAIPPDVKEKAEGVE